MRKLKFYLRRWLGIEDIYNELFEIMELNLGYQNKYIEKIAKQTGVKVPRKKKVDLHEQYMQLAVKALRKSMDTTLVEQSEESE